MQPVSARVYPPRRRQWHHLDTCQFHTLLIADVPRVNCPEHGVRKIDVPWAEEGSGSTALFEALAIDWLQEASIQTVTKQLGLSWDAVDGILQRAVKRAWPGAIPWRPPPWRWTRRPTRSGTTT